MNGKTLSLVVTGTKIAAALVMTRAVMDALSFDDNELAEFQSYLSQQGAVGALLNPTYFANQNGFHELDQAKARLVAIRQLLDMGKLDMKAEDRVRADNLSVEMLLLLTRLQGGDFDKENADG